jgi:hypothetical protein
LWPQSFRRPTSLPRLAAVTRAGHDLDVRLDLEQRGKGAKHHALVFGD